MTRHGGGGRIRAARDLPLTLRGDDREHVDELNAERRLLTYDRDAALTEAETLTRQLEQTRAENGALSLPNRHPLPRARLTRRGQLAEADDVVTTAKHAARSLVRDAERQVEHLLNVRDRTAARLRALDDAG
ncbi:hypothetical protein [Amycolatopsis sp. H20-H5]|uniref:hypothetical protein n=1 Tax=Amycolatopsis sp. H20-H5 TaxID=3046309 RepID=UPI002DB5F984|nr:hypothetical protein [Amycolatopsis sp. H20-H5]MEC3980964.1 hypothetical protein [Amycolatopsis sp. H20-H5]